MPVTIPSLKSVGAAAKTARDKQFKGRVIKGIDALRCCEQQHARTMGKVVGVINDIMGLMANADGQRSLALVPVAGASWLVRAVTLSPAEVAGLAIPAGPAVLGATVLLSGLEFLDLAQTKGAYDALSLFGSAIGTIQRLAPKECDDCIRSRLLTQSRKRKHLTAKIYRRL